MAWSLGIHHIDLVSRGDATLIIVREHHNIKKTVLIDGGENGEKSNRSTQVKKAEKVHNYITSLGITAINIIIVTHYDADHFAGITYLLNKTDTNIYDNAIIYDPGQPPYISFNDKYYKLSAKRKRSHSYRRIDSKGKKIYEAGHSCDDKKPESSYLKYISAIKEKAVKRATLMVNSFDIIDETSKKIPNVPLYYSFTISDCNKKFYNNENVHGGQALPPNWLVGKEIIWGNGEDGTNERPKFESESPEGAPTLTCISANKWILKDSNSNESQFVSNLPKTFLDRDYSPEEIANIENGFKYNGEGTPDDNAKSLGFLLEFNNFKYYIAGDLEEAQEDGCINPNDGEFRNGVRQYINPTNSMKSRVLVLRTSHHGGATSTSRDFVTQLRSSAAIISSGTFTRSNYNHPSQRTINVLDGYEHEPINSAKSVNQYQHPNRPPAPPYRPIPHYLTGYEQKRLNEQSVDDRTNGGDASYTAGQPWGNAKYGDIKIYVSEQESCQPVEGHLYHQIRNTANQINDKLGIGMSEEDITKIADKGATYGVYAAVASVLRISPNNARAIFNSIAYVGQDENASSIIERALNASKSDPKASYAEIENEPNLSTTAAPWLRGFAEAIAWTVTGQSANEIKKAIQDSATQDTTTQDTTTQDTITQDTATLAGRVGHYIYQELGAIPAGYAVVAVMLAATLDIPDEKAATLAAALAVEITLINDNHPIDIDTDNLLNIIAYCHIFSDDYQKNISAKKSVILAASVAMITLDQTKYQEVIPWALAKGDIKDEDILMQDREKVLFNVQFYNANPSKGDIGIQIIPHRS